MLLRKMQRGLRGTGNTLGRSDNEGSRKRVCVAVCEESGQGGWVGDRRCGLQWSTLLARPHQRSRTPSIQPPPEEAPGLWYSQKGIIRERSVATSPFSVRLRPHPVWGPRKAWEAEWRSLEEQGHWASNKDTWGSGREGDHDILFRYLFLMQINNSQTIRTNTFVTYSAQHESTSYIYELIYLLKKSVRINFTDGETKGTWLAQIQPKFDLITAILTIALNAF